MYLFETFNNRNNPEIQEGILKVQPDRNTSCTFRIAKLNDEDIKYTQSWMRTQPVIKSYSNFLEKINSILSRRMFTQWFIFSDQKTIYVFFTHSYGKNISFLCKYRDSNKTVFNYMKTLLKLDNKNISVVESNVENNFIFFIHPLIFDLLLTKKEIESNNEEIFTTFKKKSKNGKIREIVAPHEDIKRSLRNLNETLQRVYDKRNADFQIAYKKNKNIKTGALLHTENNFVFNIDLKDFYPSCKKELVKRYTDFLFLYTVNRDFVEEEFFNIILKDDGLFIGSPISGTLANAIISKPVLYLKNICNKFDMKFSVYADDISFSSNKFITQEFIEKIVNEAFTKYGIDEYFKLNSKKSIGYSGMHRKITGVSINENNQVTVSRNYYRNLRTQIHHLSQGDTSVNLQALRGKIAYATMIDDSGKIKKYLNQYKDTIDQYHLCSSEKMI